jgi:hypothetical protein
VERVLGTDEAASSNLAGGSHADVAQQVGHDVANVEVAGSSPVVRSNPTDIQGGDPVDAVLVVNADLGPLHRVSLKHAIRMLLWPVAEIHEAEPDRLIGGVPDAEAPLRGDEVALQRWPGGPGRVSSPATATGAATAPGTPVPSIMPRSRGGRNSWANTVAACGGCNQRKGDRTPAEARMPLRVAPAAPTWAALAQR